MIIEDRVYWFIKCLITFLIIIGFCFSFYTTEHRTKIIEFYYEIQRSSVFLIDIYVPQIYSDYVLCSVVGTAPL